MILMTVSVCRFQDIIRFDCNSSKIEQIHSKYGTQVVHSISIFPLIIGFWYQMDIHRMNFGMIFQKN